MLDFETFEAVTFDCYGTLIDWERGILDALQEICGPSAVGEYAADDLLETFGRLEAEAEQGPYKTYGEVLRGVFRGLGAAVGVAVVDADAERFAASVGSWPPFDDSAPALRALGSRYRLAVLSNVDDDLFAGSARALGIRFEHVITAQQLSSYKPSLAHFHEAVRRLGLPPARILHVAQSLYHDIAPATQLGVSTVWVNRRRGRAGGGATKGWHAEPDLEVPDLASLVTTMGLSP
jgi:2-haloacid dehalogenase